jgi:hypothetical protein
MKEEITETHKKIQELEANGGTVEELWLLFKTRLNQSVIDHIPHKTLLTWSFHWRSDVNVQPRYLALSTVLRVCPCNL